MSDVLCKAAKAGELDRVKQLVEQKGVDVNEVHSVYKTRAVDFAAQNGHLDVVKYLYSKGAKLAIEQPQIEPGFLYWVCSCNDLFKREALLNWLLEDSRYQELGDAIEITHIEAALGRPYQDTQALHAGLLSRHYAVYIGNKQAVLKMRNEVILEGYFQGVTAVWLLADNQQWNLLRELAQKSDAIDLNAAPTHENNKHKGTSVAWWLAHYKQWNLLKELAQKSSAINLNVAATHWNYPNKGTSVAWWLAYNKQWDLLRQLAKKSDAVDLNAAPTHARCSLKRKTLLTLLTKAEEWDLLKDLLERCCLSEENSLEKLQEVIAKNSRNQQAHDLIKLVKMEYLQRKLRMQIESKRPLSEMQALLSTFFVAAATVSSESSFYSPVQQVKAAVLLELRTQSVEIAQWVISVPLKAEIESLSHWNKIKDPKNTLSILALDAYHKSGERDLVLNLMLDIYGKFEALKQENEVLRQQTRKRKRSDDEISVEGSQLMPHVEEESSSIPIMPQAKRSKLTLFQSAPTLPQDDAIDIEEPERLNKPSNPFPSK